MKFDLILSDAIDWIRSLLWRRKGDSKARPYEVILSSRGKYGILSKVVRNTPRSVLTFIYTPYRYNQDKADLRDIHICLDHLGVIEGQSSQPYSRKHSHRISVYSASHFLDKSGSYDLEVLYSRDYDLQLQSPYRDNNALIVMAKLAVYLKDRKPSSIDWDFEISSAIKEVMGGSWNTPSPDKQGKDLSIEGTILDGAKKGKRVKIEFKD